MSNTSVYLEAAKLVASGKELYSCYAIFGAAPANLALIKTLQGQYSGMFSHRRTEPNYWWNGPQTEFCTSARVFALLLMAEIAKDQ